MNPIDGLRDDHFDHEAPADWVAAERLSAQFAGLRPVQPGPDLRERIAAELAAEQGERPDASVPRLRLGVVGERLAWAAGGAVAASLALVLAGAVPVGSEPVTAATVAAVDPVVARPPRVSEEAVGWSDEGIRFVDEFTPARVLRRTVIERHLAGDGAAEVRVPREDVIILPVALR